MRVLRAYISGPLTNGVNPERLRTFYELLATLCKARGIEAYLPHKHTDPIKNDKIAPADVYSRDKREVEQSDLLLAYAGIPAHGVGAEVVFATNAGVDMILIHETDVKVSRLLLGSPKLFESVVIVSLDDASGPVEQALDRWVVRKRAEQQAREAQEVPSVLTDPAIFRKILSKDLKIVDPRGDSVITVNERGQPVEREHGQIDAHGYKLRAGDLYSWRERGWVNLKKRRWYNLRPGESVVIETFERLALPLNVAGTIHSLARLTLAGCSHTSTSIHPGWGGLEGPSPLCVEIHNVGMTRLSVSYKERFCRVLFFQAAENATIRAPTYDEVTTEFASAIRVRQDKLLLRRRWLTVAAVGLLLGFSAAFLAAYFLVDWKGALATIAVVGVGFFLAWVFSERSRLGFGKRGKGRPSD